MLVECTGLQNVYVCQNHAGGKSAVLELYTRCLHRFITAVAKHSVSVLLQYFPCVLHVVREKLLSSNMSL